MPEAELVRLMLGLCMLKAPMSLLRNLMRAVGKRSLMILAIVPYLLLLMSGIQRVLIRWQLQLLMLLAAWIIW